ncbi:MAG: HAMP domain-containing sensor histidine kinase [Pseudomonadota bacterium]
MSSPPLSAILGSSVFRLSVTATIAIAAGLIAALWAISYALVWQIEAEQRTRITAAADFVMHQYQATGEAGLIDYFAPDGVRIRPAEDLIIARSEDELIGVLRGPGAAALAGFRGLYGEPGWSVAELDYDIVDGPVLAYRFEIDGELQATIALFVPPQRSAIRAFRMTGTWALGLISLPLGILIGLLVGRAVGRRLGALAETIDQVASGAVEARANLSGSGDEFDRMSASLNKMLDRIEALTRNIEYVSVGVAHDLKTPLGNVGGRLQLMTRDIDDRAALERHIDAAEQHIATLLRTFDALLRLGEVEAGSRRAQFKQIRLSELVADLGTSYEPVFQDADKMLKINVEPGLVIEGDEALLVQMASNMLENIIEHGRDGAQAWVTLSRGDGGPVLEVGDDGPGIPEPHRERLFERFYRVDSSRSAPGNGLGLSLVKAIADLHGADIALAPAAPGTVLVLEFPAS